MVHGVCFTRTCLAIRKYTTAITLCQVSNIILRRLINISLRTAPIKNTVKKRINSNKTSSDKLVNNGSAVLVVEEEDVEDVEEVEEVGVVIAFVVAARVG